MDIRLLIREAVAYATVAGSRGSLVDRQYVPREKVITLCQKYIKRYGFVKSDSDESTYSRLVSYITKDPFLENIEADTAFCKEFMKAVFENKLYVNNLMFNGHILSSLHGPQMKVMDLKFVAPGVDRFMRLDSMSKSKPQPVDEPKAFYKLKLKSVTIKGMNKSIGALNVIVDKNKFVFQDQAGNYYVKFDAPPAIHMRVAQGNGKVLTTEPYELRLNDLFSFRGKVDRVSTNKSGAIVNYLAGLQPL